MYSAFIVFVSLHVFQYMEFVSSVYLECREQTLDVEQLVAMTCMKNVVSYLTGQ